MLVKGQINIIRKHIPNVNLSIPGSGQNPIFLYKNGMKHKMFMFHKLLNNPLCLEFPNYGPFINPPRTQIPLILTPLDHNNRISMSIEHRYQFLGFGHFDVHLVVGHRQAHHGSVRGKGKRLATRGLGVTGGEETQVRSKESVVVGVKGKKFVF
jgi:hypothetical protein